MSRTPRRRWQPGCASVAVVTYGSTQRTVGRRGVEPARVQPVRDAVQAVPARHRLRAWRRSRHMHEFGTTREQLAEVAVAAREWALLNPAAWEKKPLSIADVLNARPISDPFTVRDCCLVTDGGGAIVHDLRRPGACDGKQSRSMCWAAASRSPTRSITSMPDLTHTGAIAVRARRRIAMAGMKASDIDVLALYDAFTINTILFLEDLGFCPKGEGGRFVAGGRIAPGGGAGGEHQRRRAVVLPSRHVRAVPADRGGAPVARRMRRAAGGRCRHRASCTAMAACCRRRRR